MRIENAFRKYVVRSHSDEALHIVFEISIGIPDTWEESNQKYIMSLAKIFFTQGTCALRDTPNS